ncbi:hypothetical protein VNO77_22707 [Canavalia gladiata]|uniref:Uncharacterized protein n=1 Tax=Canavalia gladiata TaxID=3824 RepID=A0AAN9Q890_CANGL
MGNATYNSCQLFNFMGLHRAAPRIQTLQGESNHRVGKCVEIVRRMFLAPQARINGVSLLLFPEFSLLLPSAPKLVSFLVFLERPGRDRIPPSKPP